MDEFENVDSFLTIRELIPTDPVGIDSFPEQVVKKRTKEGFNLNVLLVGETGIGKSTLASSLFNILPCESAQNHFNSLVSLKCQTCDLRENDIKLKLSIVETVGFGDQLSRDGTVKPIIEYIESQFESYFREEIKVKRSLKSYHDTRIHVCLYFICPTGHSLKPLDIFCMKKLHNKVNIVPIIAKSDFLSKEELEKFKKNIKSSIEYHNIKIYRFPNDNKDMEGASFKLNNRIPFAICASTDLIFIEDELVRARVFPWGVLMIEDEEHSDFLVLKKALIEDSMEDMAEKTHTEYYEFYRKDRMIQLGFESMDVSDMYQCMFEQRKKFEQEISDQEETIKEIYIEKVRAKTKELDAQTIAMQSKYEIMFNELKEEEESIHLSKMKLENFLSNKSWAMSTNDNEKSTFIKE